MRNDRLREVFEQLGFDKVSSLLSSGNILFSSAEEQDLPTMEADIQAALQQRLGIDGGTLVRSRTQLQGLVDRDPFDGMEHSRATYLGVTFFRDSPGQEASLRPDIAEVHICGYDAEARALCAVVDSTQSRMPDYMSWLKRHHGAEITTRTWNTVLKVLHKSPPD